MLPPLTDRGDLPPGIHPAGWSEIEQRFGTGSVSRAGAYAKLRHLHQLAERTEQLVRFLVFGSFVSAGADPRDVDVVLVMAGGIPPGRGPSRISHAVLASGCRGAIRGECLLDTSGYASGGPDAGVPRDVAN